MTLKKKQNSPSLARECCWLGIGHSGGGLRGARGAADDIEKVADV